VKNIFVFGADDFDLAEMRSLPGAGDWRFHTLFSHEEVKAGPEFPVRRLYEDAQQRLQAFPDSIDAIVGYWDFPVSTMLPLLRRRFDLPTPSFEAVLKCEHKYWSRLEQQRVIPAYVPAFCAIDPFADQPRRQLDLDYPFWIKPVKSASSFLGFMVRNDAEFEHAIRVTRRNIFRFAKPFNYLLQFADLPDTISPIDGNHCIAEAVISRGRQCTLEGYVQNSEVCVYGVVDSIREGRHRSSFSRYQYPSLIPRRVQRRMVAVTARFLTHIDFDDGPFNIEYYWDSQHDSIRLLEINARISKSHCPLFRHVDGVSHHQVMLDTALGRRPDFPHRQGRYRYAAKFMWRMHEDAVVTRFPSEAELEALHRRFPSAEILFNVRPDMKLSELSDQDSYSYEIGVIFLGGRSQSDLLHKYRAIREEIPLGLEPVS
jgi:hypothetical protein